MAKHYTELMTTPNAPRATGRGCGRCGEQIAYPQTTINGLCLPCYKADRAERQDGAR